MERQYTRLDAVRARMDRVIQTIPDEDVKRAAYVHLYGVGLLAALIALRRGFDRETAELAGIAGMLHDLVKYVDPEKDTDEHPRFCADFAREEILGPLDCFSEEEKALICAGIRCHGDTDVRGSAFEEIIKDADAAQHALRNPMEDAVYLRPRMCGAVQELLK